MTRFTDTKFNAAFFDSGLFYSARASIAGNDAPTGDASSRSVELAEHESTTRPHADGVLVLHGDFSSLAESGAGTEDLLGAYNFIAVEATGSEITPGIGSEIAQDGLIDDAGGNGNEAKLVGFVDGTSNTIFFATNNVVDSVNVKYTFSNADDDSVAGAILADRGGQAERVVAINAAGGWDPGVGLFEFPQTETANGSTTLKFDTDVVDVVTDNKDPELLAADAVAGGTGKDARLADITDGTSNTLIVGRTDGSAASSVVEEVAVKYTMFDGEGDGLPLGGNGPDRLARVDDRGMHYLQIDSGILDVGDLLVDLGADDRVSSESGPYTLADGIEGDASKNVANGPAGEENLSGNVNNIDLWVGAVVLDVGDVLIGVDAADDDGNLPVQTRTAGGGTTLQAEPDGQANGIIAVLIGLSTDIPGPLDNSSLTLD